MQGKCHKCGDQELRVESDTVFRHDIPWLESLLQREVEHACPICGEVVNLRVTLHNVQSQPGVICPRPDTSDNAIEQKRASVIRSVPGVSNLMELFYPAVFRRGENILIPTSEGNVYDLTQVDRHGNPDMMADFAEEYLRQFRILMPTGRLPNYLIEIMPPLLLLFIATELAIKAFLIRSDKSQEGHSLLGLYKRLDCGHRKEIEQRFADSNIKSRLLALGIDAPKVEEILGVYSETYDGRNVYMNARYYAEPAMRSKGKILYPIFLPDVVRALIDTYRIYSGHERLRRLGADLQDNFRDSGNDNHGEWGLIPSSLGLVVVVVSQKAGKDAKGEDLRIFNDFKKSYPTGFSIDWMYGGNTLLFYRDNGERFFDGKWVMSGLECRVWSNERLGLHSRDLYLLADALDCAGGDADRFGYFPKTGVEGKRIT